MSDEKNETKINVENLPMEAKELTPEEAREVKGGIGGDWNGDGRHDVGDIIIASPSNTGRKK